MIQRRESLVLYDHSALSFKSEIKEVISGSPKNCTEALFQYVIVQPEKKVSCLLVPQIFLCKYYIFNMTRST